MTASERARLRTAGTYLTVEQRAFEDILELPPADLVYAGFALPFCRPAAFPVLWEAIREAMAPSGWFAGQLFGPHDTWAGRSGHELPRSGRG